MAVNEADAEEIAGQASFDISNLRPERTGLPFVAFVSQKGGARHDVRIKLARAPRVRASEMITVAVRPVPRVIRGSISGREFDLVRKWVELNSDVLVRYWNGAIEYTEDMMELLKPLPETDRS
jgi:hypothetical protein